MHAAIGRSKWPEQLAGTIGGNKKTDQMEGTDGGSPKMDTAPKEEWTGPWTEQKDGKKATAGGNRCRERMEGTDEGNKRKEPVEGTKKTERVDGRSRWTHEEGRHGEKKWRERNGGQAKNGPFPTEDVRNEWTGHMDGTDGRSKEQRDGPGQFGGSHTCKEQMRGTN
jgi:hypothetical protein